MRWLTSSAPARICCIQREPSGATLAILMSTAIAGDPRRTASTATTAAVRPARARNAARRSPHQKYSFERREQRLGFLLCQHVEEREQRRVRWRVQHFRQQSIVQLLIEHQDARNAARILP